jgi:hypothetical protein
MKTKPMVFRVVLVGILTVVYLSVIALASARPAAGRGSRLSPDQNSKAKRYGRRLGLSFYRSREPQTLCIARKPRDRAEP